MNLHPTRTWQEEFDEGFTWGDFGNYENGSEWFDMESARSWAKAFISSLLSRQQSEVRSEVSEELCRAIEMGRISGNFDVLLHSVTEYYLSLLHT